jgi:RNA polymerase sigma factor (sigma-70 family)
MLPATLWGFIVSLANGAPYTASYISNTTAFPDALTPEEETAMLQRMIDGDEDARNILVERNLRLVAHVVKKFEGFRVDTEDLISIGTIGLIKAINTFDVSKNTRLGTYAARCIENEVLMHLRSTKKRKNEVLLYDPIGSDNEGNEISLIDILGTGISYSLTVGIQLSFRTILAPTSNSSSNERTITSSVKFSNWIPSLNSFFSISLTIELSQ